MRRSLFATKISREIRAAFFETSWKLHAIVVRECSRGRRNEKKNNENEKIKKKKKLCN